MAIGLELKMQLRYHCDYCKHVDYCRLAHCVIIAESLYTCNKACCFVDVLERHENRLHWHLVIGMKSSA